MDRVDEETALVDHEDIVVHNCCRALSLSQRFDCLQLAKWPVTTPCHNDKTHQVIEPFRAIARFDKTRFVLGTVLNV